MILKSSQRIQSGKSKRETQTINNELITELFYYIQVKNIKREVIVKKLQVIGPALSINFTVLYVFKSSVF